VDTETCHGLALSADAQNLLKIKVFSVRLAKMPVAGSCHKQWRRGESNTVSP